MLSKQQISLLASLKYKKYRQQHGLTLVEGKKPILEMLQARFQYEEIFFLEGSGFDLELNDVPSDKLSPVNAKTIKRISTHKNPEGEIAVIPIPENQEPGENKNTIYLYKINDPGNLGTIIRTAVYFNINQIVLSPDSVEVWSPKVIRASMGSIFQAEIIVETELDELLSKVDYQSIIATTSHGQGITSKKELRSPWLLLMGSESHGLPDNFFKLASHNFSIPKPGYGESLNVSVAVGIILHYLVR